MPTATVTRTYNGIGIHMYVKNFDKLKQTYIHDCKSMCLKIFLKSLPHTKFDLRFAGNS